MRKVHSYLLVLVALVTSALIAAPAVASEQGPTKCYAPAQEQEYKKVTPAVEEVSHQEWRYRTRVHRPDSTVERKFVSGYNFVDGGTVTFTKNGGGQVVVSGHWVQSAGWHQIPDSVINAYWGAGGITQSLLGGSEASPKGNVPLNVYGGPNVSVPYYALEVTIAGDYTEWGPWSAWSTTNPGPNTDIQESEVTIIVDIPGQPSVTEYMWSASDPGSPWVATGNTREVQGERIPCPVSLTTPEVKDICGWSNDHYGLPDDKEGVTHGRDGRDILATVVYGYEVTSLPAGWVSEGEGVYRYAFNDELFDEATPCDEQPVNDREVRDGEGTPTCSSSSVATWEEERTRSYTYDVKAEEWVAGEWSEWTKVAESDGTRPLTAEEKAKLACPSELPHTGADPTLLTLVALALLGLGVGFRRLSRTVK